MARKKGPSGKSQKKKRGPTDPSRPTIKRLFAVSSNRCAFPKCKTSVVDPATGSIVAQICHIEGEKDGAARHNLAQSDEDRQSFENLVLMCGPHHKVIDDNEPEFPRERLHEMKEQHEATPAPVPELTKDQIDGLIKSIFITNVDSVVQSFGQTGGQTGQNFTNNTNNTTNFYSTPQESDEVVIDGKLNLEVGLEALGAFGCPGLRLTIACRSKRQAKIQSACLSVEGTGFAEAVQQGFDTKIRHEVPEGKEAEFLLVELIPMSQPNAPLGYVLDRDDVCWFFLPIAGLFGPFQIAPPEKLTVCVTFFDDTEKVLMRGDEVQVPLKMLVEAYGKRHYQPKQSVTISIRLTDTKFHNDLEPGTVNSKPVHFGGAAASKGDDQGQFLPIGFRLQVADVPVHGLTIGGTLANGGSETYANIAIIFFAFTSTEPKAKPEVIRLVVPRQQPFPPNHTMNFLLPHEAIPAVTQKTRELPPDQYGLLVRDGKTELFRIHGHFVKEAIEYMATIAKTREQPKQPKDDQ